MLKFNVLLLLSLFRMVNASSIGEALAHDAAYVGMQGQVSCDWLALRDGARILANDSKDLIVYGSDKIKKGSQSLGEWARQSMVIYAKEKTETTYKEGLFGSKESKKVTTVVRRSPRGAVLLVAVGTLYTLNNALKTVVVCTQEKNKQKNAELGSST